MLHPNFFFAILVLPLIFCISNTLIFPKAATPFESFPIPNELPETEKVTAIILNYKRFENIQIIVDHLCRVDYITEILVWNNNVDVILEFENFTTPSIASPCLTLPQKLQIYNSPSNLYFLSRFLACSSFARNSICYFQDDDWLLTSPRAMYRHFLKNPGVVHTITNEKVLTFAKWKWCVWKDEIYLHTCFSWLGTGAFIHRHHALQFLSIHGAIASKRDELKYSDMYFTLWMNQVPYVLETELTEMPDRNEAFTKGMEGVSLNWRHMTKAVEILVANLKSRSGVFNLLEVSPKEKSRDVRSPSKSDKCLFLTNHNVFPHPRKVRFIENTSIAENEKIRERAFSTDEFTTHPYHFAVDGNTQTFWKGRENIRFGDYIGLDLLDPVETGFLELSMLDGAYLLKNSHLEVSENGKDWDKVVQDSNSRLSCEGKNNCQWHIRRRDSFRFIKVVADTHVQRVFNVNEISFIESRKNVE